ncbi:hypothetical protein N9F50_01890 [Akkermansiaceae bacterium]|nr:hypothetical protein [Akkermansiaceae bacterium]
MGLEFDAALDRNAPEIIGTILKGIQPKLMQGSKKTLLYGMKLPNFPKEDRDFVKKLFLIHREVFFERLIRYVATIIIR